MPQPPNMPPWFDQAAHLFKVWSDPKQNLFQAWVEGMKAHGVAPPTESPQGLGALTELFAKSMEGWAALAKWPIDSKGGVDASAMRKLFDPEEWGRARGGFDLALEHLTEGPTYATLFDLDRKMLVAQKLAQQRAQDTAAYQAVMQKAWNKAFERFINALGDAGGTPVKSGRELLDLWIAIANDTLTEMHRTPEFLEAQRKMTRASADYRLQEREIAEVFCEMNHIPTRSEVDELQRTVTELRRELRSLKAAQEVPAAAQPPSVKKASTAARRTPPASRAVKAVRKRKGAR
jgi:polyhydroxyalkanoate synthesis regulator phasin